MSYGNNYLTYPQMYYPTPIPPAPQVTQPQQQQSQQPIQNQNSIVWVQGEAGAKSYLLAPNTTIPLWDSEKQTIYLKSTDSSGMPTIKYIDYTIRETNHSNNVIVENPISQEVDFATKDDIANLAADIADLKRRIDNVSNRRQQKGREAKNDDE